MTRKEVLLRRVLPLVVLAAGGLVAWWLIASAPAPREAPAEPPGLLVETMEVARTREKLTVNAQGTVVPAQQVTVLPQVSGRILEVHPELKPGGVLREGERMVTIDPADFQLAVEQRQTELREARAQLELEQGRRTVAESEWKLFQEEFGEVEDAPREPELALREPQLQTAQARVARAEAALKQAQLQLERSRIDAPFHALVVEESASEGQFVQPQQAIARLVGADRFWVRTYVAPEKVVFIDVPRGPGDRGSPATVLLDLGAERVRFEGYVSRLEGTLDEQSRMAQLIIAIPDPLGVLSDQPANGSRFPLLLNAYVNVDIAVPEPADVFVVPREAVHGGSTVYVYDDGRLAIRELDVLWERPDAVLARGGLRDGERLVLSNINTPLPGMRLRLAGNRQQAGP